MRVFHEFGALNRAFPQLDEENDTRLAPRGREGILLLVAVLTAVGSFAGERAPSWYALVTAAFASIGILVLMRAFVWPPIADRVQQSVQRRRLDRNARDLSVSLHHLVREFAGLVNPDSGVTFARYFWDLAAQDPAWRAKLPGLIPPWYFAEFVKLVQRSLERSNHTYEDSTELAQAFNSVVVQYGQVYVRPTIDALRRLEASQLPDSVRGRVNFLREEYAAFARNLRAFGKAANARCNTKAFPEYFDLPEPL